MKGIDTCALLGETSLKTLHDLGYSFVGRYLAPNGNSKRITPAEAKRIIDANLGVLLVWESTAARARLGSAAGAEDGSAALKQATLLGAPPTTILYFAVDYDAREDDFDAIERYLRAARDFTGAYEIGVYGSFRVIEEMHKRGVCRGYWQCVAWSYLQRSAFRTVYQSESQYGAEALAVAGKIGFAVDIDECADADRAGIWMPPKKKHWYDDVMRWAEDNGILRDGRPEDTATRAELAQMFFNYDQRINKEPEDPKNLSGFLEEG